MMNGSMKRTGVAFMAIITTYVTQAFAVGDTFKDLNDGKEVEVAGGFKSAVATGMTYLEWIAMVVGAYGVFRQLNNMVNEKAANMQVLAGAIGLLFYGVIAKTFF
jgi:hypothetical protein